jgi:hypothetical protein
MVHLSAARTARASPPRSRDALVLGRPPARVLRYTTICHLAQVDASDDSPIAPLPIDESQPNKDIYANGAYVSATPPRTVALSSRCHTPSNRGSLFPMPHPLEPWLSIPDATPPRTVALCSLCHTPANRGSLPMRG